MTGEFSFGGEEKEGYENHHQRGVADRHQVHGEGGQDDEDHSNGAGHDGAGVVELDVDTERADQQNDESDVGVHDVGKDALFEGHLVVAYRLAGQVESYRVSVEAFETFAFHLAKQILLVWGNVVDQLLVEGLLFGEGLRFAHGALGQFDVAATLGGY